MSSNTLATELKKINLETTEAPVKDAWALAYVKYMMESELMGLSISPTAESVFDTSKAVMVTALNGLSTAKTALQGTQLLVAAIKAFWVSVLANAATIWIPVPTLVPLPVVLPAALLTPAAEQALAISLASVFTANMTGGLSESDSVDAIVAVLHPANAGAIVTQNTPPTPTPLTIV